MACWAGTNSLAKDHQDFKVHLDKAEIATLIDS